MPKKASKPAVVIVTLPAEIKVALIGEDGFVFNLAETSDPCALILRVFQDAAATYRDAASTLTLKEGASNTDRLVKMCKRARKTAEGTVAQREGIDPILRGMQVWAKAQGLVPAATKTGELGEDAILKACVVYASENVPEDVKPADLQARVLKAGRKYFDVQKAKVTAEVIAPKPAVDFS